jgi:hypothetical protein
LPRDLPPSSPSRLAARLGAGFAEAVSELPTGIWSEPIQSSYGLHLVWVHERLHAPAGGGDPARWAEAHRRVILEEALQILRRGVDVIRYDRAASP